MEWSIWIRIITNLPLEHEIENNKNKILIIHSLYNAFGVIISEADKMPFDKSLNKGDV